jgi:site-specific DNA recombinase
MAMVAHRIEAQKRAAIYVRVSTPGQERDGTSLETQEQECLAHAIGKRFAVAPESVYREVFTGADLFDRPALSRLREALRRRDFDLLIVHSIDRLSRDPVHVGVILAEADYHEVAVEFVTEDLDNSDEGQLIRFVRGYAAKVERVKFRERS